MARRTATKKTSTGRKMTDPQLFEKRFELMVSNCRRAIKGKDDVIRLAFTAMLANGHVLFEDVPGTGKTALATTIAKTIDAEVNRIQCTPDLLPGDVTGSPVLDRKTGDFVFRPGPVFANVFLADEVNRATPKTQSAMLEAMQERQVTVDGITHMLPEPFFVLATENPVELAGTFPLPEAQLDRFLFKLSMGYMDKASEIEALIASKQTDVLTQIEPVVDTDEVVEMMGWARGVSVSEGVVSYIVELVNATRTDPALQLGGSMRASQALLKASSVLAASQGRDDVIPDDVKVLAPHVLIHRLILTPDAQLREESLREVVDRIVQRVKVPVGLRRGSSKTTVENAVAEVG